MNTHDKIKLPKLPEPVYSRWVDGVPAITLAEHAAILGQYARAAIEADRQARGEPVAASEAYDTIDSFLRNNLYDDDYALYSSALDDVYATPQPQQIPEGYALVPTEPTDEMLKAAQTAWLNDPARRTTTIYRAMLEAAPEVKEQ